MPVSAAQLQQVLAIVADEDQLKVTVNSAVSCGVFTGLSTTIGGLLAGPGGLIVGGLGGLVVSYLTTKNFKPVSQVLKKMNAHQRQLLYEATWDIIDNLEIEDCSRLLQFLSEASGKPTRQQLVMTLIAFLINQMGYQMAD